MSWVQGYLPLTQMAPDLAIPYTFFRGFLCYHFKKQAGLNLPILTSSDVRVFHRCWQNFQSSNKKVHHCLYVLRKPNCLYSYLYSEQSCCIYTFSWDDSSRNTWSLHIYLLKFSVAPWNATKGCQYQSPPTGSSMSHAALPHMLKFPAWTCGDPKYFHVMESLRQHIWIRSRSDWYVHTADIVICAEHTEKATKMKPQQNRSQGLKVITGANC